MNSEDLREAVAQDLWLARLARGRTGRLTVRSGSMAPLLRIGEDIVVGPPATRPVPGDLIVLLEAKRLICHRLMLPCGSGRYWQKGDANPSWQKVHGCDIVGRPLSVIVSGRWCRLEGWRFRWWNMCLWLLVGGSDAIRWLGRPFARPAPGQERPLAGVIASVANRIRAGEREE
jgi:hypothetical protein